MPIVKYVPPKKKIRDERKPEGNYYIANCDNCGTEFYPMRSNAKYCSSNCATISHRLAVAAEIFANGGKITAKKNTSAKKPVKKTLEVVTPSEDNAGKWKDISPETILRWGDVTEYFKKKRLRAKFLKIIYGMNKLAIDESCKFEINKQWYNVVRTKYNGFDLFVNK